LAGLILTGSLFAGLGLFNYYAFSEWSLWLNTIVPSMMLVIGFTTVTVWNYIAEQKSKRFIHDAFGRYLSPKVISQIIENPRQLKLGGDKRMMTAFFSDVAGFTTISEKLSPAQLVKLLNQYLSEMTDIIHHTDGTLDKYEGDAIIAFWGAPIPVENHAEQCVLSAVRQQRKLTELREEWRKKGKDELAVRIGINTGPMVVGNMGSKERMDYTMIGDAVNLAARLEGANKYYGSYILISEYTYEEVRTKFLCRQLDIVRVQGKKEPIRLYEVVEELGMVNDGQRRLARYFEQALNAFHNLDFTVASKLFERCDKLRAGGDIACKLYLTRCAELIESPPPDDWDRVYDLAK
jgi:adenylate cyclase